MTKKKSSHRIALLWFGAILSISGNIAIEIGRPDGAIATVIGVIMAMTGCYCGPVTKIVPQVLRCGAFLPL